jgi:transcription antitermination factor NusG
VRKHLSDLAITELPLWYALSVQPKHERLSGSLLAEKGIEQFSPFYTEVRRWSKRNSVIERPLFPRYIFARFAYNDRSSVLETLGVTGVVKFGPVPLSVPDYEIDSIRTALEAGMMIKPVEYVAGDRVRIDSGCFEGYTGKVVKIDNADCLVVSIDALMKSVVVMPRECVSKAA